MFEAKRSRPTASASILDLAWRMTATCAATMTWPGRSATQSSGRSASAGFENAAPSGRSIAAIVKRMNSEWRSNVRRKVPKSRFE